MRIKFESWATHRVKVGNVYSNVCSSFSLWFSEKFGRKADAETCYNAIRVPTWLLYAIREMTNQDGCILAWRMANDELYLKDWTTNTENWALCQQIRKVVPFELFAAL